MWEITYLDVQVGANPGQSDSLYANGKMQVPVYVSIKATDANTGDRHYLTDKELSLIRLVDYWNVSHELSGDGWGYSDKENEFDHSLPSSYSTDARHTNDGHQNHTSSDSQSKLYWVKTTKTGTMNIAASIKQPNGTVVTTHSADFDSHVALTGKPPIQYTTDTVEIQVEETNSGDWHLEATVSIETVTLPGRWKQKNHYVSSKVHPFKRTSINGLDNKRLDQWHNCFCYHPQKSQLSSFYIWDSNSGTTKHLGEDRPFTLGAATGKVKAALEARINQKSQALCLTHLNFSPVAGWEEKQANILWKNKWSDVCWFQVVDIYGNSGEFWAQPSEDYSTININNRK